MKINVTGNAGLGQSMLSQQIAFELNLPLTERDRIIWQPKWQRTLPEVCRRQLRQQLQLETRVLNDVSRLGHQKANLYEALQHRRL